jgi:hypothetical protein
LWERLPAANRFYRLIAERGWKPHPQSMRHYNPQLKNLAAMRFIGKHIFFSENAPVVLGVRMDFVSKCFDRRPGLAEKKMGYAAAIRRPESNPGNRYSPGACDDLGPLVFTVSRVVGVPYLD